MAFHERVGAHDLTEDWTERDYPSLNECVPPSVVGWEGILWVNHFYNRKYLNVGKYRLINNTLKNGIVEVWGLDFAALRVKTFTAHKVCGLDSHVLPPFI